MLSPAQIETARNIPAPWFGKLFYYLFPYRRPVVLENMRRVFGKALTEKEIVNLAQAYSGHFLRFGKDFITFPFLSAEKRKKMVRIENAEAVLRVYEQKRGIVFLTGHFGNWEVAMSAAMQAYPEMRGVFHIVRRPIRPKWFGDYVIRRTARAGLESIGKSGTLFTMLKLLRAGKGIVFVFDQHAGGRDGVWVNFLGTPAGTFKSPAVLSMNTGAAVIPADCWRDADGTHVLRFEEPLPLVEGKNQDETIKCNTENFNNALGQMLLRHPEQWIWMHRRWKTKK
ncbi:MAG TPA: lysophospholipid acyltransferase family protein [Verrucomicrobiae bacterium]|nr:lysophospholipid acyltransferase family protein [Verrucomicrobiae bacterium]